MNTIASMSDVEFALAFTAASLAWTGLVFLALWVIEQAVKKICPPRVNPQTGVNA